MVTVLTKNSFTEDSERQVGTGTALTKNSFTEDTEDKLNGYRYGADKNSVTEARER